MRTLILHIGTNKTGSSALQAFMKDNADYMLKQGYYYPANVVKRSSEVRLKDAIRNMGVVQRLYTILLNNKYRRSAGNARNLTDVKYDDVFDTYSESLDKFPDSADILLSSEAYWMIKDKTKYFEQLKRLPYHIKVIVYLRRQDSYLSAMINQGIKTGGNTVWKYPECMSEGNNSSIPLDYFEELEKIATVIGRENIIVRRYQKSTNIVRDFLSILDVSLDESCILPPEIVNPHLNLKCLKMMCRINKMRHKRRCPRFIVRIMMDLSVRDGKSNDDFFLWDENTRNEILQKYEKSNNQLARAYLQEDTLF